MSRVPQGSVLDPVLFLVYASDLTLSCSSRVLSYADDLKIFHSPSTSLQTDLDQIEIWCSNWLIPLNQDKCSVLHIGKNNPNLQYKIANHNVTTVSQQIDLGVTITDKLSWSAHVTKVVSKANQILYMIRKSFQDLSIQSFLKIYNAYIRPHLEFAVIVWSPLLKQDINRLEGVQRRATKLPRGFRNLPYEERLHRLNLKSLEARRQRGDLITTYRILHGEFYCHEDLFEPNTENQLREHSLKLRKEHFRTTTRKHFLSNRVFDQWNSLPENVISAPSLNSFKGRLDHYLSLES